MTTDFIPQVCQSQQEFDQACSQLQKVLSGDKYVKIAKAKEEGQELDYHHLILAEREHGTWAQFKAKYIYKDKSLRANEIKKFIISFFDRNFHEGGFIYQGELLNNIPQKWKRGRTEAMQKLADKAIQLSAAMYVDIKPPELPPVARDSIGSPKRKLKPTEEKESKAKEEKVKSAASPLFTESLSLEEAPSKELSKTMYLECRDETGEIHSLPVPASLLKDFLYFIKSRQVYFSRETETKSRKEAFEDFSNDTFDFSLFTPKQVSAFIDYLKSGKTSFSSPQQALDIYPIAEFLVDPALLSKCIEGATLQEDMKQAKAALSAHYSTCKNLLVHYASVLPKDQPSLLKMNLLTEEFASRYLVRGKKLVATDEEMRNIIKLLEHNEPLSLTSSQKFVLYCLHTKLNQPKADVYKRTLEQTEPRTAKETYYLGRIDELQYDEAGDKRAFACFVEAANEGNIQAQCALANFYEKGFGTIQDLAQAFELYEKAADAGDSTAQYHVSRFYANGYGQGEGAEQMSKDYATRLENEMDVKAKSRLGRAAYEYAERAANQGDAAAKVVLGKYLRRGIGCPEDQHKGADILEEAMEQGNLFAIKDRGSKCWSNRYALKYYRMGAAQNDPDSIYRAAYSRIKDTKLDRETIDVILKSLCVRKNMTHIDRQSYYRLSYNAKRLCYEKYGLTRIQRTLEAFIKEKEGATDASTLMALGEANIWLGDVYQQNVYYQNDALGDAVRLKHYVLAEKYFKQAVATGNIDAQYSVGVYLINKTTPADPDQASIHNARIVSLLEPAAKKGHLGAQMHLARHYELAKNDEAAYYWYKQAASQGDFNAVEEMVRFCESSSDESMQKEAAYWKRVAHEVDVQPLVWIH